MDILIRLFNTILACERMFEEWRMSVLVLIFKNKGDVQSCWTCRGMKLMNHTMKIQERVFKAKLRREVMMEKYREGLKELHWVNE